MQRLGQFVITLALAVMLMLMASANVLSHCKHSGHWSILLFTTSHSMEDCCATMPEAESLPDCCQQQATTAVADCCSKHKPASGCCASSETKNQPSDPSDGCCQDPAGGCMELVVLSAQPTQSAALVSPLPDPATLLLFGTPLAAYTAQTLKAPAAPAKHSSPPGKAESGCPRSRLNLYCTLLI